MTELDREHFLQKVVAASGFLFALLILPVAQYLLLDGQNRAEQTEQGSVAGVSTEEQIIRGNIPQDNPLQCLEAKRQELTNLQEWSTGRLAALQREYEAAITPYQQAIPVLTGDNVDAERAALQGLIADEAAAYSARRDQIVAAVDARVKEVSALECGTVPAE